MPHLEFFAGLWNLHGHPSPAAEWTLEKKFAEVRRRGFPAIGGRFEPEAPELCRRFGLGYVLYLDAGPDDFAEQLHRARDWAPRRINVQLGDHDSPPADAAEWWIRLVELADRLHLPVDLEVHRGTATETPEKTAEIAERVRAATGAWPRFCLDFSHPAVVKHLLPPYAPHLLPRPELIAPVRQFHARPFNGHHAQIPVSDRHGNPAPEARPFFEFVDTLLAAWRRENPGDATLLVCPENGPLDGGYALSCFPDVWEDTVRIRDEIQRLWDAQEASSAIRPSS